MVRLVTEYNLLITVYDGRKSVYSCILWIGLSCLDMIVCLSFLDILVCLFGHSNKKESYLKDGREKIES